jgi:FkbM family methyltransferase
MPLISYAQNAEDVLLWRALGHIPNGFYIDVGANDPLDNSVTKMFYDAGWHGINIEPMPSYHEVFLRQRPRDINLALACGAADGAITLYDTPAVNGWASTDAATAAAHRAGGVDIVEHQVPLRTLAGICADHAAAAIHFLKIDVEGFEAEVLRGMDLQRWRPWVLVIEATLPGSPVSNHEQWEALVTAHAYQFAWFDGLNRYYVAAEHADLLPTLAVQPNVFDQYVVHHLDQALRRVQALDAELSRVRSQFVADLERESGERTAWARQLEADLLAVHASWSWRLTAPLRLLAPARLRSHLRRVLMWLALRPAVRHVAFAVLRRVPGLQARFMRWYARVRGNPDATPVAAVYVPPALAHLPQSARRVLADLERPGSLSDG